MAWHVGSEYFLLLLRKTLQHWVSNISSFSRLDPSNLSRVETEKHLVSYKERVCQNISDISVTDCCSKVDISWRTLL